jgi:hypothetical protein
MISTIAKKPQQMVKKMGDDSLATSLHSDAVTGVRKFVEKLQINFPLRLLTPASAHQDCDVKNH